MTEIDFGTLVTAVVNEMNCTTSELFGDELTNPDLAVKRYNRNVIGAIRQVFDDAEAEVPPPAAPVVPTCSNCGAVLGGTDRYCSECGMPLLEEATRQILEKLLAKEVGASRDDPRFQASLARIREEMPGAWDALIQKIAVSAKA